MSKFYCAECGNVGELPDSNGTRCSCIYGLGIAESDPGSCLSIPEAYRGVQFDAQLLPEANTGSYYRKFMQDTYLSIISLKLKNKNLFISSPMKTGKTVFAYSCIEKLFRRGLPTFPLFDVLELSSILKDVDMGRASMMLEGLEVTPLNVYTAPYLFVKITNELNYQVFDTIVKIVDRRTRRGNVTIFISHLSWNILSESDKRCVFRSLVGDGSFGTIESNNFWVGGTQE
jgi:hypothetical protein